MTMPTTGGADRPARGDRHRRDPAPRAVAGRLVRRRVARRRPAARLSPARPSRLAPRAPRRRPSRGRAGRPAPPVPRQLRRARGVRGGPPPGRALPRHELAGGPGRLEPPLAGGARRGRSAASASRATRRSSSTAATPRATPNEKWPGRRAGQIAATRAALILRYAGVDDVRLLDGGYDRWVRDGQPARDRSPHEPTPVAAFGAAIPQRPELIVDIDEAKEILADRDGAALVSVRTWREHIGAVSGYNYIGPAGRIAGDVWGNCGTDAYHMQHYRNVDNTMRPYPEIAANWAEAGITPDKWVAFYCGTGWRASETWFYAWLQGWQRIAVYDGGWFEWSAGPGQQPDRDRRARGRRRRLTGQSRRRANVATTTPVEVVRSSARLNFASVPSPSNRRRPLPRTSGWIWRTRSSISSRFRSDRTSSPLPRIVMFLPGSSRSRATASAASPAEQDRVRPRQGLVERP